MKFGAQIALESMTYSLTEYFGEAQFLNFKHYTQKTQLNLGDGVKNQHHVQLDKL